MHHSDASGQSGSIARTARSTQSVSKDPSTITTANGTIDAAEQAIVNVKDFDMFVTIQQVQCSRLENFAEETDIPMHGKKKSQSPILLNIRENRHVQVEHNRTVFSYLANLKSPQRPNLHRSTERSLRLRAILPEQRAKKKQLQPDCSQTCGGRKRQTTRNCGRGNVWQEDREYRSSAGGAQSSLKNKHQG